MVKNVLGLCALACVVQISVCGILGGWTNLPTTSKDARDAANVGVKEIDARGNSMFRSVLVKITHAKRQVVAGYQYKIAFVAGLTNCMKVIEVKNLKACKVNEVQECTANIWIKEWENFAKVDKLNCGTLNAIKHPPVSEKKVKYGKTNKEKVEEKVHSILMPGPMMPGAPIKGDSHDEDVRDAAMFYMDHLNAKSNSMFRIGLNMIKSVTKQLVAGTKYTMVLEVGPSTCRNTQENMGKDLEACPVQGQDQLQDCSVVVWDRPWLTPRYELLESTCATQTPPNPNIDAHMSQGPDHEHLIGGNDHMAGRSFQEFKKTFNKVYKNEDEELKRFETFKDNLRIIKKLKETELGSGEYGVTQFADLNVKEFRRYLGFRPDLAKQNSEPWPEADIPHEAPPKTFDWRDHNAVTGVKNQGSCGSCWAFSTTGNIEGQWAIKKKQLISLSEQELVDCDKLDQGCEGGLPSLAYKSIMKLGGLETEKKYPYEGSDDHCSFKKQYAKVDISGAVNISTNEADMAAWLAKNGPISIGINAFAMQFYWGGISHPWKIFCNPASLDHGVLIVGYSVKGTEPYWMIKNSWGPSWGVKGYYLVYRGGGVCGLNRMPTSAVVN